MDSQREQKNKDKKVMKDKKHKKDKKKKSHTKDKKARRGRSPSNGPMDDETQLAGTSSPTDACSGGSSVHRVWLCLLVEGRCLVIHTSIL